MLLVQWSRNLADLERRLVAELDLRLEPLPAEKYCQQFERRAEMLEPAQRGPRFE